MTTMTIPEFEHTLDTDPEAPFYEDYLVRRRELEAAGKYTYNDDFRGCFTQPISGPNPLRHGQPLTEDTVIYYCQVRHRMLEIKAKVEAKLAEGYELIEGLDTPAPTKFAGIVLFPTGNMSGEYSEYVDARLIDTGTSQYVIPKGKRTHGYMVGGRKVLVKR